MVFVCLCFVFMVCFFVWWKYEYIISYFLR